MNKLILKFALWLNPNVSVIDEKFSPYDDGKVFETLTDDEMDQLKSLKSHPGWVHFLDVAKSMKAGILRGFYHADEKTIIRGQGGILWLNILVNSVNKKL